MTNRTNHPSQASRREAKWRTTTWPQHAPATAPIKKLILDFEATQPQHKQNHTGEGERQEQPTTAAEDRRQNGGEIKIERLDSSKPP